MTDTALKHALELIASGQSMHISDARRIAKEALSAHPHPVETVQADVQPVAWRCFHCDEVFTDRTLACEHFGADEFADPACQIKMGAERSLLSALRHAEKDAADAWCAIQNETTDAAKAYYAQAGRHGEQLRATEELGYERGLADGRAECQREKDGMREAIEFVVSHFATSVDESGRRYAVHLNGHGALSSIFDRCDAALKSEGA